MGLKDYLKGHFTTKQSKQIVNAIEEQLESDIESAYEGEFGEIEDIEDLYLYKVIDFKYNPVSVENEWEEERLKMLKGFRQKYISIMGEVEDKINSFDSELREEGIYGVINFDALRNLVDGATNLQRLEMDIFSIEESKKSRSTINLKFQCCVEIIHGESYSDVSLLKLEIDTNIAIESSNETVELLNLNFKSIEDYAGYHD